jgi:hypothetical protein
VNNREREIFLAALDIASPDDRERFVEEACAGDNALDRRVRELLQAHERAGRFLGPPRGEP